MKIERILYPTDFSENSAAALPCVTSMAEKYGAEIHILYVMKDYPAFGARYGDYDPEEVDKMQQMEQEMANRRLDEVCEKFLNACPLFFRHTAVGDPSKEILTLVQKEKIDIVIMANRGSESHFDFGSVAERVLKCTTVPVVMVPA
jgi:nucleotide-binding universal stress UspA family protein